MLVYDRSPDNLLAQKFLFCPLSTVTPAMSADRRKRSRAYEEVQNVLSPGSIETTSGREEQASPSITAHAIAPQATLSKESIKEISDVFSEPLAKVFKS